MCTIHVHEICQTFSLESQYVDTYLVIEMSRYKVSMHDKFFEKVSNSAKRHADNSDNHVDL